MKKSCSAYTLTDHLLMGMHARMCAPRRCGSVQPHMALHPGIGTSWLMTSMLLLPMVRSVVASSHIYKLWFFSTHRCLICCLTNIFLRMSRAASVPR